MGILDQYEAAHTAFRTGKVLTDTNEQLLEHLSGLANQNNINEGTQHRDIIRGITINHILLQRHIDSLNKQNTRLSWLVVTLTVASLFGAGGQIWFAYKADKKAETTSPPVVTTPQTTQPSTIAPTPTKPPSSGQLTKKSP